MSVSPLHIQSCRPLLTPALRLSQRFLLWVFGAAPGFACMRCASFKPFWHLALASQAPVAIVLEGPRRFRGAVLFRGPRPSSMLGAPFWPSGLTVRRSRPPSAAAELRALACSLPGLHSPCLCKPPPPVQALIRWRAVAVAGFACWGRWGFKGFGALVLLHRSPVALFCVAQCLTLRSSGPAFCGPLTLSVRVYL